MSSPFFIVTASLLCLVVGCSSDDTPGSTGSSGQAGASAGASTTTGGTVGTGGSSTTGGTGTTAGTSASGAGGATAHAGASAGPLSEACQKYCECHEKNCATTPIPGGKSCGDFCTAMTQGQLDCRQNMCGLVPAQPNNNHCAHSVGIDECL